MKNNVVVILAVVVLTFSSLALAQMNDKGKEMTGDKAGMMEGKGGMMGGKGMMDGGMMKMMGMMHKMHGQASVVATSDGGALVVIGGKLIKYDSQLNVIKEVDLPKPEMGMADTTAPAEVDHAAHH